MGVWGQSPWSGGQGGEAPLKLKAFELSSIQWKRKNAMVSLLCNHNKLGYLRSEPKPNVPLGWGSRGPYPRKQNAFLIWELGRTMEAANFGLWGHVPLGSATGPGAEPR